MTYVCVDDAVFDLPVWGVVAERLGVSRAESIVAWMRVHAWVHAVAERANGVLAISGDVSPSIDAVARIVGMARALEAAGLVERLCDGYAFQHAIWHGHAMPSPSAVRQRRSRAKRAGHATMSRDNVTPDCHATMSRDNVTPDCHATMSRDNVTPDCHATMSRNNVTPDCHACSPPPIPPSPSVYTSTLKDRSIDVNKDSSSDVNGEVVSTGGGCSSANIGHEAIDSEFVAATLFSDLAAAYPARGRASPLAAQRAFADAIYRVSIAHRSSVSDAARWLIARAAEYASSPMGRSQYCLKLRRWLDDGEYDAHPSAWQCAADERAEVWAAVAARRSAAEENNG